MGWFWQKSTRRVVVHKGDRGKWWWKITDSRGHTEVLPTIPKGGGYDKPIDAMAAARRFLKSIGADKLEDVYE